MAKQSINVGIIGYGVSANIFHIPFISASPEFNLHGIFDRDPKRKEDARTEHLHAKVYNSVEEMLKDPDLHLIIVATIPESHFHLAKLALEARKHVVVEKPFTTTYREAEQLIRLANSQQVILTVFQSRRWDADFLTLQELIRAKVFGRIVEFETRFDRHQPEVPPDSWRAHPGPGSGPLYALGTHVMDQVVILFGLPRRLTCFTGFQRSANLTSLEDSCTILLHYDGLIVTAKIGVLSPEVRQLRFWVRGEKASFKKYHLDPQEDQINAGLRPGESNFGFENENNFGVLSTDQNGKITESIVPTVAPPTYAEFYRKLAAAVKGDDSEPPVRPQQAADVIRLVELALASSKLGRTLDVQS